MQPARLRRLAKAQRQRLQLREREQLERLLARLTGFRFVTLVTDREQQRQARWLRRRLCGSGHSQCWLVGARACSHVDLYAHGGQLPIVSNSIDAVLLPHTLDVVRRPHQLLREIDRILCERGQLVVVGYNPLRPAALARQLLWPWRAPALPAGITPARIADWLGLLNFELESLECYGSLKTRLRSPQWLQRILAPLRPSYVIFARKRRVPITPVGLRQRLNPRLVTPSVVNASSSRAHLRLVK